MWKGKKAGRAESIDMTTNQDSESQRVETIQNANFPRSKKFDSSIEEKEGFYLAHQGEGESKMKNSRWERK